MEITREQLDEVLTQLSQQRGAKEIANDVGVPIDAVLAVIFSRYRVRKGRVTIFEASGNFGRERPL